MYKKKLFFFGAVTAIVLIIALAMAFVSAHLNRTNLTQYSVAQNLLAEHQRLSNFSYRLFKQYTDEIFFGAGANQADVRKKKSIIVDSLSTIRELEQIQRQALGEFITRGSVEDTDELEANINEINAQFEAVIRSNGVSRDADREGLRLLLEDQIDQQFREAIDAAVTRQSKVVASLHARIQTLNNTIVWFTIIIGIISLSLVIYGCYWLFSQLYEPLVLIKNATKRIADGDYQHPITENLDQEFKEIALSINTLSEALEQHQKNELASRKELKLQVEQRTAELTNLNLELTRLDGRRRQFINDISHELRTPLTIIRGESQIALRMKSASNEDFKKTLQSVLDQSVSLSRLVNDLLLLARSEMSELHIQPVIQSIVPIVEDELDNWRRHAPSTSIELSKAPSIEDALVSIDVDRIRQVLSILLDNAIKYSNPPVKVVVSVDVSVNDLILKIKDNGKGLSLTELESIFERFVRFSKDVDGSGLGLPIAKAIIEAHQGSISAESVDGQGAIFIITIPLTHALAHSTETPPATSQL